jgi:hypothetical protein
MSALPLAAQTIYAELLQQLRASRHAPVPGSIGRRAYDGVVHLYSTERHGSARRQIYLGPAGNPEAEAMEQAIRRASAQAKERRKLVAMLRSVGISAPSADVCRVLDALSREKLFEPNRLVLVGTLAYALYPLLLGHELTASALMTNDIDLTIMPLVITSLPDGVSIPAILARGDATLEGDRQTSPPSRFRNKTGLLVDFLTVARRKAAVFQSVPQLGISAEALSFMDYLIEDTLDGAIAWQDGILVRVPAPARFAVHKLLVAQLRASGDPKRSKDLVQARELISLLDANDPDQLEDALDLARSRGKKWTQLLNKSLALIAR